MNKNNMNQLPTLRKLLAATVVSMLVAGLLLVTAILPAEFGIDPTGTGKLLGLTALNAAAEAAGKPASEFKQPQPALAPGPASPPMTGTVTKSNAPFRTDEMSLLLQPNEGTEIKVSMRKGELLVFNWVSEGGPVNVDLHGEKFNDGDNSVSYWKGMQLAGDQGIFVAPYDGTHGWFWRNRGDKPVTVKIKASGFYEKFAKIK